MSSEKLGAKERSCMSMGDFDLLKVAAGAIAVEGSAISGHELDPVPEHRISTPSASHPKAVPCYDHAPRTIVPPLTNGGVLRSMTNGQLAAWFAEVAFAIRRCGALSEEDYFRWMEEPSCMGRGITQAHDHDIMLSQLGRYLTCDLVEELKKREGVETTVVEPYFEGSVRASGPAVVLVVTD